MTEESREQDIRRLHEAGRLEAAATLALETYGPEVFGFLMATLRSEPDASDVFSMTSEDLWVGFAGFEWRASLRTWLYRLARSAVARHLRDPARRPGRRVPLSQVDEIAVRVRSETLRHLRTESKDALARVRESLTVEQRSLLVLRVDRRLGWKDIASVLAERELEGADLEREAARLRKRFQDLKALIAERLSEMSGSGRGDAP